MLALGNLKRFFFAFETKFLVSRKITAWVWGADIFFSELK